MSLMDDHQHHDKAPITEAVLDIRTELADEINLEHLAHIGTAWHDSYPTRHNRMFIEGELSVGPEVSMSSRQRHLGYIFVSDDELQTVQARLDGFSFSRFRPYTDWEHFCGEARRLWDIYRDVAQVRTITRVAVRYINRLDLPTVSGYVDFKDYLRTIPEVSPDLPQGLNGYFMQLQIPMAEIPGQLVINQAMVEPPGPEMVSVLLDLDLFRTIDIPQDEEQLWETFERLREVKNRVFEACITKDTRELIN